MKPKYLAALLLLLGSACAPSMAPLRPMPYHPARETVVTCEGGCTDTVEVRFLGVAGFLIRRGRDAVMTAPLFSNPPLDVAGIGHVHPNPTRIDGRMRTLVPELPDPGGSKLRVHAILVGHGHYDHLLDVPYLARRYAGGTRIYANRASVHTLRGDGLPDSLLVTVDDSAATSVKVGRWLYVDSARTIRIMPIESEHGPHFLKTIKLYHTDYNDDEYERTPGRLPRNPWNWREGKTHAYVIDFLEKEGGPVRFRLYFTDAVAAPPLGLPPPLEEGETRRYDASIICVGTFDQVVGYPEGILRRTQPRYTILGHWENFFRDPALDPVGIPFTNTKELRRRLDRTVGDAWITPEPGVSMKFCTCS